MKKLELWFPYKPLRITQAWGLYNPAYSQFGFNFHNGIDYTVTSKLCAPVRMKITHQENFPKGGGLQVEAVTTENWVVPHIGNEEVPILFVFCHNKEFIHKEGDILEVGDEIAIPDNTGFSTGPHSHIGAYRLTQDEQGYHKMDTNYAHGSFDFAPYYNNYYAEDYQKVMGILYRMRKMLSDFLKSFKI